MRETIICANKCRKFLWYYDNRSLSGWFPISWGLQNSSGMGNSNFQSDKNLKLIVEIVKTYKHQR